jgi:hypothetical protein
MAYTKYSLTPADNNAAPPNGAPEGMLPSAVNDTMRDMMSQIRDVGDGIRGGTYTMTAPVITGGSINGTAVGATTASTGAFTTLGATGVATFSAGTVSAPAITTTGDTNTGIFFPAADTIAFTEGGVESLRIDSSGKVGINVSTNLSGLLNFPTADSGEVINYYASGTTSSRSGVAKNTSELRHYIPGTDVFTWYTGGPNGTERMRLYNNALLFGTTTATAPFVIKAENSGGTALFQHNGANSFGTVVTLETTAGTDRPALSFKAFNGGSPVSTSLRAVAAGGIQIQRNGGVGEFGATMAEFLSSGGDILKIYADRNGGSNYFFYNTSNQSGTVSDARTKHDINPINTKEALEFIEKLTPSSFRINQGDSRLQAGFIAQNCLNSANTETQKSVVINYENYNENDIDSPYLGVADRPILAYAVAAIQEQQAMIEILTNRLNAIESK